MSPSFGSDGHVNGKAGDQIVQELSGIKEKAVLGESFLARGYFVSTVGLNEDLIRIYVKYQEEEEKREERGSDEDGLFQSPPPNPPS